MRIIDFARAVTTKMADKFYQWTQQIMPPTPAFVGADAGPIDMSPFSSPPARRSGRADIRRPWFDNHTKKTTDDPVMLIGPCGTAFSGAPRAAHSDSKACEHFGGHAAYPAAPMTTDPAAADHTIAV